MYRIYLYFNSGDSSLLQLGSGKSEYMDRYALEFGEIDGTSKGQKLTRKWLLLHYN